MPKGSLRFFQPLRILLIVACLAIPPALGDEHIRQEDGKNPILATVNGEEIFRSDIDLARSMLPVRYQRVPLEIIYPSLVDQVIDSKLIEDLGREAGLEHNAQVMKRIEEATSRIIQQAFLTHFVSERLTEEALHAHYDELVGDEEARKQVHARQILVEREDQALELIEELEDGADFEKLAKQNSIAPEGARGGDLGYFSHDEMVPAFSMAAFATAPGEIIQTPVKTRYGWHVIKVEDSRLPDPPDFEDIRADLESSLSKKVMGELVAAHRQQANIVFFNLDGSPKESPLEE